MAALKGRPRAYDPATALTEAMKLFWVKGYSATSLDDLGAVMGMNRPSIYAAFGDKRALYLRALAAYRWNVRETMREVLSVELDLADALTRFYDAAIKIYLSPEKEPRGCFIIGTALTEAASDPDVRQDLAEGLFNFDHALAQRIAFAKNKGELDAGADPKVLAVLAVAMLYRIAIGARAGASHAELLELARIAIETILPQGKTARTKSQSEGSRSTRSPSRRTVGA